MLKFAEKNSLIIAFANIFFAHIPATLPTGAINIKKQEHALSAARNFKRIEMATKNVALEDALANYATRKKKNVTAYIAAKK